MRNNYMPRGAAIALGNFDGVHLGHMSLINALTRRATVLKIPAYVFTFPEHPRNTADCEKPMRLLTSAAFRHDLLMNTAIDGVYYQHFDKDFSSLSPEAFARDVLARRFAIKLAAVGENYSFGRGGAGSAADLARFGAQFGFEVLRVRQYMEQGGAVSSSRIRDLLGEGRVSAVQPLLGRLFSARMPVSSGFRVGRVIGVPTANMNPDGTTVLPGSGVYITSTLVRPRSPSEEDTYAGRVLYRSVTSVGNNPTVGLLSDGSTVMETHIIGFTGELTDGEPEVFFHNKLRDMRRFDSLDSLRAQISRDILSAKEYFSAIQ